MTTVTMTKSEQDHMKNTHILKKFSWNINILNPSTKFVSTMYIILEKERMITNECNKNNT